MTITERITKIETRQDLFDEKINTALVEIHDVHELAASLKVVVNEIINMNEKMDSIDNRLQVIEKQPASDFIHYKRLFMGSVITVTIGGIITAVLAVIFK